MWKTWFEKLFDANMYVGFNLQPNYIDKGQVRSQIQQNSLTSDDLGLANSYKTTVIHLSVKIVENGLKNLRAVHFQPYIYANDRF